MGGAGGKLFSRKIYFVRVVLASPKELFTFSVHIRSFTLNKNLAVPAVSEILCYRQAENHPVTFISKSNTYNNILLYNNVLPNNLYFHN